MELETTQEVSWKTHCSSLGWKRSLCHIPETIDIINQLYSNKILKQIQRKKKSFTKNRILRECDSVGHGWGKESAC